MDASETVMPADEEHEHGSVPIAHPKWPVPPRVVRTSLEEDLAPYQVTRIPHPAPVRLHPATIDLTAAEVDDLGADVVIDLSDDA